MNEDRPAVVLDTTCLLGIHRLLKVLSLPFSKLIASPYIRYASWPGTVQEMQFIRATRKAEGTRDSLTHLCWNESKLFRTLKAEEDKVNTLLARLARFGLLVWMDFEDVGRVESNLMTQLPFKRSYDSDGVRTKVMIHLLEQYASLPLDRQIQHGISFQDIDAISFACGYAQNLVSFNASVTDFLEPMGRQFVFQEQQFAPSSFQSRAFDDYLRKIAAGEATAADWMKLCLRNNPVVSMVKNVIFTTASIAGAAMGIPIDSAIATIETLDNLRKPTAKGLIRIASMFKIDHKAALLLEEIDRFYHSPSNRPTTGI
jgi:hypothetical protein